MLPSRLLRYETEGRALEPLYLDGRHVALVRGLVVHYEALAGKTREEVDCTMGRIPEVAQHDERLVAGLRSVIEEFVELRVEAPLPPKQIRERVFKLAGTGVPRRTVFQEVALQLGLQSEENLSDFLYADLKERRRLYFSRPVPGAAELISRYNFRLLQGLVASALHLRVDLDGQARAVYRLARLNGLLMELKSNSAGKGLLTLEITGPLSLFKRTRKYGFALARFLPACSNSSRYHIEASLFLHGVERKLVVTQVDRVLSSQRPSRTFDSKLEERFYKDFIRLGSDWDIFRESTFIRVGSQVFLPDFSFRSRVHRTLRADLEIVGFWTRDYLARKRSLMDRLGNLKIIFCIDRKLCCDHEPTRFPCVTFSRRVPAQKVLELLERLTKA